MINNNSIAIDLGGSFVCICKQGEGIVFKEPMLISVQGSNSNYSVIAMGKEAKKVQAKIQPNVLTFSPITEGTIKSVDYTALYLKYALKKLFRPNVIKNLNCYISVPCGLNPSEIKRYKQACYKAGFKKVEIIYSIICCAMFSGCIVDAEVAQLVVDIGGTKTDVACICEMSVVKGATLGIGGKAMDNSIISAIKEKYNLLISELTAEKLKMNIGSLYRNDTLNMEVVGVNLLTQTTQECVIFAKDIRDCLLPYFNEIVKLIKATLKECPTNILTNVLKQPLVFCGGVAGINGLEEFMSKELNLPVIVVEDYNNCTALGLTKFLYR